MEALEIILEDWATWQRGYRVNLGYPIGSAGFSAGGAPRDFEDLCNGVDSATMKAVDAAVGDLPAIPKAAVLRRYGVSKVFGFPSNDYHAALLVAYGTLMKELPRRGVVIF